MLKSGLCDHSDVHIFVKVTITVEGTDDVNKKNKKLIFNNNASYRSSISNISNTLVDNAKGLNIVIPICNLLQQLFYDIRKFLELL